jgi:hypothetical protein
MVFICFCLGFFFVSKAQNNFGFEWASNASKLLKFPIVKAGVYQIKGIQIQEAGWSLNTVNPSQIALYRLGQEVPVLLQLENNSQLQANDAVVFYANKNNGKIDQPLYQQEIDQPHMYNGLFEDTAWYFLAIVDASQQNTLRYQQINSIDTIGLLPFQNFEQVTAIAPQEFYYRGRRLPANESYYVASYAGGESWTSGPIAKGQNRLFNVHVNPLQLNSVITMKAVVMGVSDYYVGGSNTPNHHINIRVLNRLSQVVVNIDTLFKGAVPIVVQTQFNADLLDSDFQVQCQVIDDLGLGSDVQVIALLEFQTKHQQLFCSRQIQKLLAAAGSKGILNTNSHPNDSTLLLNISDLKAAWVKKNMGIQLVNTPAEILLISHDSILPVTDLKVAQVQTNFSDELIDYVIVSSKKIEPAAMEYANYRSAKFNTKLYFIEDLANTYAFGHLHPIAIQQLCNHLNHLQQAPPRFLFLLGKGYQLDLLKQNSQLYDDNLVPTIGDPPSDQLYTEYSKINQHFPAYATGRLPASNNEEVLQYLTKIKAFESQSNSVAWWKKQVLHVSGGSDYQTEQLPYTQQLYRLKPYLEKSRLGYLVHTYNQNNNLPQSENPLLQLLKYQNEGLQLFTFLGHGSLSVLDVPIGSINELNDTKKPAFYYLNGCAIGNPATLSPMGSGKIYAKDYLCNANKGALGWLAHSSLTLNGPLFDQMDQIYQSIASTKGAIGVQMQDALRHYTADLDLYKIEHARQLVLQGDPAIELYQPTDPDLQLDAQSVWVQTPSIHAQMSQIQIAIVVKNLGRAIDDSANISVKRILPNQQIIQLVNKRVPIPNNVDTVVYNIDGILPEQAGLNELVIRVSIADSLNEFNLENNSTQLVFYLPGSGIQSLLPLKFESIATDSVMLSVQRLKQDIASGALVFEIDTTPSFLTNNATYHQFVKTSNTNLYQQQLDTQLLKNTVYWWRVKTIEDSLLVTGTFKNDSQFANSFTQSDFNQFMHQSSLYQLIADKELKRFNFANDVWSLGIENRRWDHRMMGITEPYLLNEGVGNCMSQGVVALVFDPNTGSRPVELTSYPFNCTYVQNNKINISNRYYTFNTNTILGEQQLVQFIQSVPAQFEIALFSRYASNIHSWQATTKQVLAALGAIKLLAIQTDYTAWALIGSKSNPLLTVEDTVSNAALAGNVQLPPLPNEPQDVNYLKLKKQITGKWYQGSFTTPWIGPVADFKIFNAVFKELEPNDKVAIQCYVKNKMNEDSLLLETTSLDAISIGILTKGNYPFVQFKFIYTDSVNRTPAQLANWRLTFLPLTELLVDPFKGVQFNPNQMIQGDQVSVQLPIRNISSQISDSCQIHWMVLDSLQQQVYSGYKTIPPVYAMDTTYFEVNFSSQLMSGKCALVIEINPNRLFQEIDYSNNYFKSDFIVESNSKMPDLTVLIDGRKIVSGELISAKPQMEFQLAKIKVVEAYKDSIPFEVKIRKPKQAEFETLNLLSPSFKYIAPTEQNPLAILQYAPELLSDGMYTLKVKPIDPFGNWTAPANDFQFEVKQAASISHFYPYPNPFTTQMRFVFTLTGAEIPEKILVRIFTVDGRLVKEINQDELGNIHIGNNISSWYWDGKDQFGDQLANGVYFYTVNSTMKGNSIEINQVNANENQFFKAHTGKIYLMK